MIPAAAQRYGPVGTMTDTSLDSDKGSSATSGATTAPSNTLASPSGSFPTRRKPSTSSAIMNDM